MDRPSTVSGAAVVCHCETPRPDEANDRGLVCAACGRRIWPNPAVHGWDGRPESYAEYRALLLRTIAMQAAQARERGWMSCGDCGLPLFVHEPLDRFYRCFHCEVVFCPRCAGTHFGRAKRVDVETGRLVAEAELGVARCSEVVPVAR